MNNVRDFPFIHSEHEDEQSEVPTQPDTEKLQRLLEELLDATSSFARERQSREFKIRNFRSARFELIDDLLVVLEEQGNHYIANSYDTGQYGYGYSPDDAIGHLCCVLEEYYDLLVEDEKQLSAPLLSHLRYLRSMLRERR